jgi:suppressor of ftsI
VIEVSGDSNEGATYLDGYYDTVNVPVRGEIKVIIPFTESTDVGKFVYHCHLLSHEDKGMMATIEVSPR